MSRSNCPPFYGNHSNGWSGFRPPVAPQQRPPPYVDHQNAKKIKNDVNVHKDTIRIEVDQNNPDYQLVSFTFDALVDGRYLRGPMGYLFSIYYGCLLITYLSWLI